MRIITVGTSLICKNMIKAFKLAGFTVHACVSRDKDRAKDFAISNGVKFYLDDYDKALTSQNFEVVYIAVPNALHYEYARKALLAGKSVIVEKPICSNSEDLEDLLKLAKVNGLFVLENMKVVHNRTMDSLKKVIFDIGPIRNVQANFYRKASTYEEFKKGGLPNLFNPKLAGGVLMDLNIYNIMFALDLFGFPESLSYHPRIVFDIDVSGSAILNYDDLSVCLNAGMDGDGRSYCLITGEDGYILINDRVSNFRSFDVYKNGSLPKRYKCNIDNLLVLNTNDFYKILNDKNMDLYNKYVAYSLMEVKTLELLLESGNIKFN